MNTADMVMFFLLGMGTGFLIVSIVTTLLTIFWR